MAKFLFVGRLEESKGCAMLLLVLRNLARQNVDFQIEVFGDGPLEADYRELAADLPDHVICHGYQDFRSVIEPRLAEFDYILLPSFSLETFGLSALEGLAAGLTVVGYAKGGLAQFISENMVLPSTDPQEVADFLSRLKPLSSLQRLQNKEQAYYYSLDNWLERFKELMPMSTKKILLVSDYLQPIGGTERYISSLKSILIGAGYEVRLFGNEEISTAKQRWSGLWKAIANESWANQLEEVLAEWQPDVVWSHSLLRFLGPRVAGVIAGFPGFKMHMYHDFGLFTAYPSKLFAVDQLDRFGETGDVIGSLLKYWLLAKPLRKQLRSFDYQLVPSAFMSPIIQDKLGVVDGQVRVLPHFVQQIPS